MKLGTGITAFLARLRGGKALKRWQRWTAYGAFAALAFLFALRQTFPTEAVKERLIIEAAAQGWQLTVADVRAAGFGGIGMSGVTLESRDGLRIPVERLDAGVRLWALLLGRRGVSFDARLFEGRIRGFAEGARTSQRLAATITGVDLSRAVALRKVTGLDLAGTFHGEIDLALDEKQPAKSSGRIDLAIDGAAVTGGSVPVPGMSGGLTVPRIGLGQITARAGVKDGKIVFDRLDARGDDLDATGEGLYFVVQPRLAFAPIFGKARLRIRDAFWSRPANAALKGAADMALAQARAPDGSYGVQIFGTLSQPQARMGL